MNQLKQFYNYLKKDTLDSWIVSLVLIIVFIKLIFFPGLSFVTGSPLPLVVVESCSMFHSTGLDEWWDSSENSKWYESNDITKEEFSNSAFHNGLNKGDIIFVWGRSSYNLGDIIIFTSQTQHPLIHRVVSLEPTSTKGDNNPTQLPNKLESNIKEEQIIGKAAVRIPLIGWVKLIFFELSRSPSQRGFCKS
jgi:signal peptidase I